jgi:hypothetical protein
MKSRLGRNLGGTLSLIQRLRTIRYESTEEKYKILHVHLTCGQYSSVCRFLDLPAVERRLSTTLRQDPAALREGVE